MLSKHARLGILESVLLDGNRDYASCIHNGRSLWLSFEKLFAAQDEHRSRDCYGAGFDKYADMYDGRRKPHINGMMNATQNETWASTLVVINGESAPTFTAQ